MRLAPGTRLGPYEIATSLGAGGMGEVYRARDSRLGREVAIKVLPEHMARVPAALKQFEREARALAALSHAGILTIFDIGVEDDISYAVTELLEGETLRALVDRGALPWRRAAEIGAALADGLAAAHSRGVTHRDLKPDNVFLTADGRIKILDFGLAQLRPVRADVDETVTTFEPSSGTAGTVGYIPPEQLRGAPAEPRGDIFSLGCVLCEMLSGKRAFRGQTVAETATMVLRDPPAGLTEWVQKIPAGFERAVMRCLEKDPEDRFQSARELADELRAVASEITSTSGLSFVFTSKPGNSIAVLPFENTTADPDTEYLSDGITESIINALAQISRFKVTPRSVVFRYKGRDADPRTVGRELGVRSVLTGRVTQRGESLVVAAELIDVDEGSQLWGERYMRKSADVLELEEEIARRISRGMRVKLTGEEDKRLAKRFTEDSEAYQLYLRGRYHWDKRTPVSMRKGAEYFQQAIDKDPSYALAYAGLADCHSVASAYLVVPPRPGFARARAAAAAAVTLDPELSEAHTSQGFIELMGNWNFPASERAFQRAIELNPLNWVAPYWYAVVLCGLDRREEAEQQIRRALELEPLSPVIMHVAAWVALTRHRYEEVVERCLNAIEIDPAHPMLHLWLGCAYEQQSRFAEGIAEFERTGQIMVSWPFLKGPMAHIQASAGNEETARNLLAELRSQLDEQALLDPYAIVLAHLGLGNFETALDWIERACDSPMGMLPLYIGDPRLDPLRNEPRFRQALARLGIDGGC